MMGLKRMVTTYLKSIFKDCDVSLNRIPEKEIIKLFFQIIRVDIDYIIHLNQYLLATTVDYKKK